MIVAHYPLNSAILNEARLYATDSIQHTMDYEGWEDQRQKKDRITYGKFGQLWVTEFCRLNRIPYVKDTSSPKVADDVDLIVRGQLIDVKTSISPAFVGQVSPGVINKQCDFFCFMLTDKQCSFITPYGFIAADEYRKIAVKVYRGEMIPNTNIKQSFNLSYFLPENYTIHPFLPFLLGNTKQSHEVVQPNLIVDRDDINDLAERLNNIERLMVQMTASLATPSPTKKRHYGADNVLPLFNA